MSNRISNSFHEPFNESTLYLLIRFYYFPTGRIQIREKAVEILENFVVHFIFWRLQQYHPFELPISNLYFSLY